MGMIDLLALTLIVLLGVPHGALDPMLAIRAGVPKRIGAVAFFHVIYISIAASFWLFWIGFGPFALIAFLALSIWHFGGDALPGDAPAIHRLAYGSWVLALPMVFATEQVGYLFGLLINQTVLLPTTVLWVAVGLLSLFGVFFTGGIRRIEWFGLAGLAALLPPLWYFVIFFCLLHSPRHLIREFRKLSSIERWIGAGVMVVMMLATVALGQAATELFAGFDPATAEGAFRLVFIGIAALTLPHMILVEVLERRERRTTQTMAY